MRLFGLIYKSGSQAGLWAGGATGATPYSIEREYTRQWLCWGAQDVMAAWRTYEVGELSWRDRERAKELDGVYVAPVWADERFWQQRCAELVEHYAHVSLDDPGMIAFTASPEHGEADRQTRMRPGKYLKKYFGDVLSARQIDYYAQWFRDGERPLLDDGEVSLHYAATPEEIARVYIDGPSSCMGRGAFDDNVTTHPTRVYGAGDLQIAYLRQGGDGRIVARALCWPEREVFGRIYPNLDAWERDGFDSYDDAKAAQDTLHMRLKALGWEPIHVKPAGFDGARILKIPASDYCDDYVMPYLDHGGFNDLGDVFEMHRHGDYSADSTSGRIALESEPYAHCEQCGDAIADEDDAWSLATAFRLGTGWRGARHLFVSSTMTVCEYCYQHHGITCEGTEERFNSDHVECVETYDATYCAQYFELAGGYYCERDEIYILDDANPPIELTGEGYPETWSTEAFRRYGFRSWASGLNYKRESESGTLPGVADGEEASAHLMAAEYQCGGNAPLVIPQMPDVEAHDAQRVAA